jgi:DNA-binding transcriptional MerR regulator
MSDRKSHKRRQAMAFDMPSIPDKLYFSIGEVAQLCDLKPHVLRYWECEFSKLNPVKRRGNRRYYTQDDIQLIMQIKHLLYCDGYTIDGARGQLKQPRQDELTPEVIAQAPAQQIQPASEVQSALANLERALEMFEEKDPA